MKPRNVIIAFLILFFSTATQINAANAWESWSGTTDFGDKQFILGTFFKSGIGAVPNKRPSGPHKELGIACTAGHLEIGFFDHAANGHILTIGSPTSMAVKFDGKLAPVRTAVNTKKGSDYVQADDAQSLVRKIKSVKTFAVEMELSSGYYRASFDVRDISKYSAKFADAGCKI
jgi:predicted enzyme involved in methoxymalonyl-ACP biosynthesis